ncbi:hypothetical protein [Paracoccus beibuensis]|uniref:hypothetical protein n=1 Tax=Paracoccus beibuensis TaxID=547602 RepID=UPI0022402E25|nr:hypothetical protein [Paracoccus beibuensis]
MRNLGAAGAFWRDYDRRNITKLGLGSYAFRWNIGIGDQHPAQPMTPVDLLDEAQAHGIALELGTQNLGADQVAR